MPGGGHKMDPAMRQHLEALQSDAGAQQRFEQRPFPALTPSERLHLDVYGFGAPHPGLLRSVRSRARPHAPAPAGRVSSLMS